MHNPIADNRFADRREFLAPKGDMLTHAPNRRASIVQTINACKAGANAAEQLHRFIAVSSLTVISPMIPFLLQYPELFDTSSHRRMFGMQARAPGAK